MSYELNIVRQNDWSNVDEKSNLSLKEWLEYAEQDSELKASAESNMYEWIAYPHAEKNGTPWFQFNNGYISTKNPDLIIIKKMLLIANALNAKVQGEEGESYDESFFEAINAEISQIIATTNPKSTSE